MSQHCAVCREPEPEAALLARCFRCGVDYHLNPYSNRPGKDCGDAILGESLGVEYYCGPCLDELVAEAPAHLVSDAPPARPAAPRPPPSLDGGPRRRRFRRIDP